MKTAADTVIEGLLEGAFGVLETLLGGGFSTEPEPAATLKEDKVEKLLADHPVILRTRVQNGLGAVALLLSTEVAAAMAAAISETEAAAGELSAEAQAALNETLEPALGGGVSNIMEKFGRNVEQLEDSGLIPDGRDDPKELAVYLGFGPVYAHFHFEGGDGMSGDGVIIAGSELVDLAPTPEPDVPEGEDRAKISDAEMGDLLGGFDTGTGGGDSRLHGNLDMVLDIKLIATARLGRIEMPISDILNLGPGSIIEIDQLVDEPIELLVNGKLVARGDVVVVDEKFGLRITEIVSQRERIESLR